MGGHQAYCRPCATAPPHPPEQQDKYEEFAQEHFEATITGAFSEVQSGGVRWGCSRKEAFKVWWKTGVVPDCTVTAWSNSSSLLSEIPRPTLTGRCCREDFGFFKSSCSCRYYDRAARKNEDENRDQLHFGPEIPNTTLENMLLMVEFFGVMEGEQTLCDTHSTVGSTTHATEPEKESVVVGVEENAMSIAQLPERSSSQTKVGGVEFHGSGVDLQQGHSLPAPVGVGGEEVLPRGVRRQILPRRSSVCPGSREPGPSPACSAI